MKILNKEMEEKMCEKAFWFKMFHKKLECVSIFLRAIFLQTYSPIECINGSICRVESSNSLF